MLLNDNEQQLSADSFQHAPINVSSEWTLKDGYSEILANLTATLHMNTPEQTMNGAETDFYEEDNESKEQILIEQLQTQLIQNQIKRTQPRNYTRILNQSNTPAHWYKPPTMNRSIYYYDPHYQKYIQQRANSPPTSKPNTRSTSPQRSQDRFNNNSYSITPRTKYMFDLYNTTVNHRRHQQKQHLNQNYPSTSRQNLSTPFRLSTVPILPRINTPKQRTEQENNFLNNDEKIRQPLLSGSKKKFTEVIMPPTS